MKSEHFQFLLLCIKSIQLLKHGVVIVTLGIFSYPFECYMLSNSTKKCSNNETKSCRQQVAHLSLPSNLTSCWYCTLLCGVMSPTAPV